MELAEQIADTWLINNRINLFLLDAIPPEALTDVGPTKGMSVGQAFSHLNTVRLAWLKASAPALMERCVKLTPEQVHDKELLRSSLEASAQAVAELLRDAAASGGRVKGFKPHVTAFLGYLTAHEAHHRGQIALNLKANGHAVDKKVSYGIWEWGTR